MELPSNSMLAETLDLDLSITYTYIIARRVNRRWPGQCPAITYTETRTMPGALYHVARERSFIERTTGMRACRGDGVELRTLPQQDDRNTGGCHAIQLVLLDTIERHHRLVFLASRFPRRMVDPSPLDENH